MAQHMLYVAQDGGHLAVADVAVRKYPADLNKVREYRLTPMSADGASRVKVARYLLDTARLAAWRAATDTLRSLAPEASAKDVKAARAAVADTLAGIEPLITASPISPTREQMNAVLGISTAEQVAADVAAGIFVIPSTRADDAAASKASKAKMTEAERTAAAIAKMFAPREPVTAEASETEASETAEASEDDGASADDASEPEPEPATEASEPTTAA